MEVTGIVLPKRVATAELLSSVRLAPPPRLIPETDAKRPPPLRVSEVLAFNNVSAPEYVLLPVNTNEPLGLVVEPVP